MEFFATYYGSSTWLVELKNFRILIDPWFKDDLFFAPGPWFFNGRLKNTVEVPRDVSLLLLTQGLPDHAHIPSLELLERSIPVFASSSACKVVERLGFSSIVELKPGDSKLIKGVLVEAFRGANVPNTENAYLVTWENSSF